MRKYKIWEDDFNFDFPAKDKQVSVYFLHSASEAPAYSSTWNLIWLIFKAHQNKAKEWNQVSFCQKTHHTVACEQKQSSEMFTLEESRQHRQHCRLPFSDGARPTLWIFTSNYVNNDHTTYCLIRMASLINNEDHQPGFDCLSDCQILPILLAMDSDTLLR